MLPEQNAPHHRPYFLTESSSILINISQQVIPCPILLKIRGQLSMVQTAMHAKLSADRPGNCKVSLIM